MPGYFCHCNGINEECDYCEGTWRMRDKPEQSYKKGKKKGRFGKKKRMPAVANKFVSVQL